MATLLDRLIPAPRLLELDHVELGAAPERVWAEVRHGNLARSSLVRALFELRTLPERLEGKSEPLRLTIDDLRSTPEQPGFGVLLEDEGREVAVGAIGQVWQPVIPFVYVAGAAEFAELELENLIKVAWSLRVLPLGERDTRLELELRVDATDDGAWRKFERYFRLIGPGSRFIRHVLLDGLARELHTPEEAEARRPLPGDELLSGAAAELTHGVTIAASPEQIWPWLVQLGGRRAGFYSVDALDNAGVRSSTELVPELQQLKVGQIIPATPEGDDGFEVLRIEAPRCLILGGLFDTDAERQLGFSDPKPAHYWQVTWAFVLERLDEHSTRLHVRARAALSEGGRLHLKWVGLVHHFMQRAMLEHLAARVEGRLPEADYRDVLEGVGGAAVMLAAFATPFMRQARSHWGVEPAEADAARPGDELVTAPLWSWTHGIEIGATPELVWHWVAQIGADRGGFYSYQWLENLAGCGLRNADAIHQEWELDLGDTLVLHPKAPPLRVVRLEPGSYFVAYGAPDAAARTAGKPWAEASWLFQLERLPNGHCKLITRYRVACSNDLATRLTMGPALLEPVGFAMDRRMLLGIKERAERQAHYALTTSRSHMTPAPSADRL